MAKKKPQPQKKRSKTASKPRPSAKKAEKLIDFKKVPQMVWVFLVALLAATTFTYWSSLDNGFVNWDDEVYVLDNPNISSTDGWFKRVVSLNYHPITMISMANDYKKPAQGEELDARPFHRTNLIFHVLNTFLVFLFVVLLTRKKWLVALFAAMLFALHPMHVESVAWISERKDVLYVFFFLLGLISWFYYKHKGSKLAYLLSIVFLLMSCLSKAMAVVFPVVLLLIDYFENRIANEKQFISMKLILEKIPHFVVAIFFGLVAMDVQGGGNFNGFFNIEIQEDAIADFDAFTIWQRITFASYGFVMYLVKLILPFNLSTFYPYPTISEASSLKFTIMPFVAMGIIGLAIYLFKKSRVVTFSIFFYLITVALVLQFLSVGKVIIADRYTYLPYVGIGILIGYGVYWLSEKGNLKTPVIIGVIALGLFWAYLSNNATKVWKSGETLWTQVIDVYPFAFEAYVNRGNTRGETGEVKKALSDFQIAIQIEPGDAEVFKSLGNAYGSLDQFDKSVEAFDNAIRIDPGDYTYYLNRGVTHARAKNDSLALRDFESALTVPYPSAEKPKILNYISMSAFSVRDNEKGLNALEEILEIQAGNTNVRLQIARAYHQLGRKEERNIHVAELDKRKVQVPAEFRE